MPSGKLLERNEIPLVDRVQYLLMLHALGGELDQVILDFLADCEKFLKRLVGLAQAADVAGFRELCHELKGSAAVLGFTGIAGCAARWEKSATAGRLPAVSAVEGELSNLLEATQRWFEDAP